MQKKSDFLEKIDTELEMVESRFAKFKAEAKNLTADKRIGHAKHVEEIEKVVDATKAKLRELDEAHDDVWEELADGVENTWKALQATLEDAVTSFEG